MSQQELLERVVGFLEGEGVAYMVTGSVASSLQGEPRATHDIDIVVAMRPAGARALIEAFPPPDYYVSDAAALQAVREGGMFNLLDTREGDKVDFWILTDEPFDIARFERRRAEAIGTLKIFVSRPEDTILMKLRWMQMSGGSQKQFTDALRVYELQSGTLDVAYMDQWAERLGVAEALERVRREAERLG